MCIKAIIFDFSGTLDNLDEVRLSAVEKALEEIKRDLSGEERLNEAKEVIVEIFRLDNEMPSSSIKDIFQKAVTVRYGDHICLEKLWDIYYAYRKAHRSLLGSFVNNFSVINEYKMFILTRTREETIRELLKNYNIDEYFNIYRTRKPSTETLKQIMKEHDLKPHECIMAGDDVTLDLMPAKMLGMKTILRSSYVDCFINNFDGIEKVLKDLKKV
ncbi:MAG: HAD-IA family hydrolase [Candidatus Eremiobacterota bacterium]